MNGGPNTCICANISCMAESRALLTSLEAENIDKMFDFFSEPKEFVHLGFGAHLGRFKDSPPRFLYLKAIGDNEASVRVELIRISEGGNLPDPSTRLAGFETVQDKWFAAVRTPERLAARIPTQHFHDFKSKEPLRNDFQGVREVIDPEPKS